MNETLELVSFDDANCKVLSIGTDVGVLINGKQECIKRGQIAEMPIRDLALFSAATESKGILNASVTVDSASKTLDAALNSAKLIPDDTTDRTDIPERQAEKRVNFHDDTYGYVQVAMHLTQLEVNVQDTLVSEQIFVIAPYAKRIIFENAFNCNIAIRSKACEEIIIKGYNNKLYTGFCKNLKTVETESELIEAEYLEGSATPQVKITGSCGAVPSTDIKPNYGFSDIELLSRMGLSTESAARAELDSMFGTPDKCEAGSFDDIIKDFS